MHQSEPCLCGASIKLRPEIEAMLNRNRFKRFICLTKDVPRVKDECAWCVNPGNGLKYCSDACRFDAQIRSSGSMVSYLVFRRDHGVCAFCGMDCQWLRAQAIEIVRHGRVNYGAEWSEWAAWGPWRPTSYSDHWWQADHIVPVSKGGGVCGLDNYRTLCLRCHKAETAILKRRSNHE